MKKDKIKAFFKRPAMRVSAAFFALGITAFIIHVICLLSEGFSDLFNRYVGAFIRHVTAFVSGFFPFSLAETIIISLPVWLTLILIVGIRATGREGSGRFVFGLASVLALLYSMFVFTSIPGYNGTSLASKLGLYEDTVGPEELADAADFMADGLERELDSIRFSYGGGSVMPYALDEMNELLLDAYASASEKYPFIPKMRSKIKPIALSEPMSYTHITGIYTYYTGEANLNTHFPDYTLPFTAAHELAHQRGILPENEANFVAFLVCCESEDPYIRYSGYLNMLEYINSALYSADYTLYAERVSRLDVRVRYEMASYSSFFKKYSDNTAADISSALNDTYLKFQGESAGEKSYGMVVDLAVAYVKNLKNQAD